jgi:hypothetical protein
MLSLLAQLLKLVLWVFGVGRKPSEAERHEKQAAENAELEARAEDIENALEASEKARELESRMRAQKDKRLSPTPRKAQPGQRVFRFMTWLAVPLLLASGVSCAARKAPLIPQGPMAVACPEIPLPKRPAAPSVIIPDKNPDGKYCFSQEEMDNILTGIDLLQADNDTLRDTIDTYNTGRDASGKEK